MKMTGVTAMEKYFTQLPVKTRFVSALEMGTVLQAIFNQTQQDVHVVTGRLKSSGRVTSHPVGLRWEGEIEYGGPAAPYAGLEIFKGGEHDFFRNIYTQYPTAKRALRAVFEKVKAV